MGLIFLTGGTGFLGSHLGIELLKQGCKVVFLVRSKGNSTAEKRIDNILTFIEPSVAAIKKNYMVVDGDITEKYFGLSAKEYFKLTESGIDEVWHVAGSIFFSEVTRENTYKINVTGMDRMLEFNDCIQPKQFHVVSTAYVCGNVRGIFREDMLDIGQSFNNPYEETKFIAEQKVREWCTANSATKTFVYRPSIVVGDSRTGKTTGFSGYYTHARTYHIIRKILRHNNDIGLDEEGRILLPLKVPGAYNADLNIVTIDYVVDMAMRIRNTGIARTFHLTAERPQSYGYWLQTSTKIMGFSEIIAASRDDASNGDEILQHLESQIAKGITDYLPYITYQPVFDKTNVKAALSKQYYEHPEITHELIARLLKYAVEKDFRI